MTVQTRNKDTIKANVWAGLDTSDRLVMRVGAALYIHGWVFSTDADIEAVYIECNGIRYSTTFPVKRPGLDIAKGAWINAASIFPQPPYTRDLSRDSDAPYDFGFVSSAIALESTDAETVEIVLIAKICGQEQHLVSRQIQILKSDPEGDFFNHGKPGSFKQPVDFQTSRIVPIDNRAPVFLIARELPIQQIARTLNDRGTVVSNPILFRQMLAVIETCYDVYSEYDFLYFNPLRGQFNDYAISKVDIYTLINGIIAHFHERSLRSGTAGRFFALSDERDIDLIPLLKTIYPTSVFVYLEGALRSASIAKNCDAHEDNFARKIRVLENGNARIRFHHMSLGEFDESTFVADAIGKILQFDEPLERHSYIGLDIESSGANSTNDLCEGKCESYLQALPVLTEHRPIFILAAGRSGTSAMTGALKVSGIAGFQEGHVFPLMDEMARRLWELAVWDRADGATSSSVRAETIKLVVKNCFDQTYGDIGSYSWLDKTADHLMIHCAPLLTAMFPNARFLFLTRHPIAVAESRRRKFGETPHFSMLEWKKCMVGWNERKHLLNESSYMECDAKDLRRKQLHQKVGAFLEFDPERSKKLSDYLATQCPEMTRQALLENFQAHYVSLDDSRIVDFKALLFSLLDTLEIHIEDTDWSDATVAWAKKFLGTLPDQFGYVLHRPENMLVDIIANFAKLMEEQRYIAEINEKSVAAWQEKYATQLANANYWKEQHDYQLANATEWREQHENAPRLKPEKNYRKWINGILNRS